MLVPGVHRRVVVELVVAPIDPVAPAVLLGGALRGRDAAQTKIADLGRELAGFVEDADVRREASRSRYVHLPEAHVAVEGARLRALAREGRDSLWYVVRPVVTQVHRREERVQARVERADVEPVLGLPGRACRRWLDACENLTVADPELPESAR